MIVSEREKQYEAVSGKKKSEGSYKSQTNVIEQFLNKCNEQDIQEAYDLLSDDCKEKLYPSINNFIDGYYNKKFNEKKSYSYQLWSGNTYKIELRQDILSTGVYSDSSYVEDYYTLSNGKLNINGYIGKEKVDKEIEKYDLKIKIEDIDFYRDYSICNIQVLNKTEKEILLDSQKNENSVFITNGDDEEDEVKFNSYIYELPEVQLRIVKGENKNISIKFNYLYRGETEFGKICFNNIIMDYSKYKTNEIQEEDIKMIEIDI